MYIITANGKTVGFLEKGSKKEFVVHGLKEMQPKEFVVNKVKEGTREILESGSCDITKIQSDFFVEEMSYLWVSDEGNGTVYCNWSFYLYEWVFSEFEKIIMFENGAVSKQLNYEAMRTASWEGERCRYISTSGETVKNPSEPLHLELKGIKTDGTEVLIFEENCDFFMGGQVKSPGISVSGIYYMNSDTFNYYITPNKLRKYLHKDMFWETYIYDDDTGELFHSKRGSSDHGTPINLGTDRRFTVKCRFYDENNPNRTTEFEEKKLETPKTLPSIMEVKKPVEILDDSAIIEISDDDRSDEWTYKIIAPFSYDREKEKFDRYYLYYPDKKVVLHHLLSGSNSVVIYKTFVDKYGNFLESQVNTGVTITI